MWTIIGALEVLSVYHTHTRMFYSSGVLFLTEYYVNKARRQRNKADRENYRTSVDLACGHSAAITTSQVNYIYFQRFLWSCLQGKLLTCEHH